MIDPDELTVLPVANPAAEIAFEEPPKQISLGVRVANLIAVILPFAGLVSAIIAVWGWGFHWPDLGLLLGMYLLTALGITVGFHRLFTHHSFETNRAVQFILAILGSMAVEGPVLKWVAMHRRHHQHSDNPEDPHSPHNHGRGVRGVLLGFWHAHLGWIFDPEPSDLPRYVPDLQQNRIVRKISALFPIWVAVGLLIPAALGGLLTASWTGVLTGFAWGWLGACVLSAPRYLEREFDLSFMGQPTVPKSRSKPQQCDDRLSIAWRGLAQHAPRFSNFCQTWPKVVGDRRELLGHPGPGVLRAGVERETSVKAVDHARTEYMRRAVARCITRSLLCVRPS